jgi:iron complex outermembrane receptor protein
MHRTGSLAVFVSSPLSRAIQAAALAAPLLLLPGWTAVAQAAEPGSQQQAPRSYSIPAGPLSTALSRFASEAGILLAADGGLTAGKQSPGLNGRYTPEQGLAVLLGSSGLQARSDGQGGFTLLARAEQGALELQATQVFALGNALGSMEGYQATHSSVATKTSMPLLETSQSVSVVTRAQMDDQGARSVAQAVRYTPGLMSSPYGATTRYDYVALRGITDGAVDNLYLDGLKLMGDSGTYSSLQVDPFLLERIDILKGPSSVLYGRSLPGGLVAMTTKKPEYARRNQLQLSAGSNDYQQLAFDVTGPLGEQERLAYRLAGVARDAGNQVDDIEEQRFALMPSLSLELGEATRLTLQALLQRDPESGYHGGLPAEGTVRPYRGQRIPRSFFEGEKDRERFERDQQLFGYQLEHRFNEVVSARQNFQYLDAQVDSEQVYQYGYTLGDYGYGAPGDLYRAYTGAEEALHAWTIDNQLQFEFDTGRLSHTLVAGLDYQRRKAKVSYDGGTVSPVNPYAASRPVANYSFYHQYDESRRLEQTGLYVQDLLALDNWRFSLGLRHDWVDVGFEQTESLYGDQADNATQEQLTGRVGVLYAFDNGLSPYVSYAESFNPNTTAAYNYNGSTYDISLLEPTKGQQGEAGLKYQPQGRDDLYTLSVFELRQTNLASKDSNENFFRAVGEITSRGVELEARFQPLENASVLASYTYLDVEYSKDFVGAAGVNNRGNTPNAVARHMAALWADYRFRGGLQLGAGARYFGHSWADAENSLRLPSYTLFDASLSYDLTQVGLAGVALRLNLNNLTDETYVSACNSLLQCYYGEERNVMATLSYDF